MSRSDAGYDGAAKRAAWRKTGENGEFLSVKLDDPSFPAAIYASLVETDETHSLIWSRSRSH